MAQINTYPDGNEKRKSEQAALDPEASESTSLPAARKKGISFEEASDPFYSGENQARLRKSIHQLENLWHNRP